MNSMNKPAAKVGVFGIGLEAYWAQFPELKERLEGYQWHVEEQIGQWATVVSTGLVDTSPKAQIAGKRFAEERVDLIFCYVGTYATSSQVLPAVQEAKVPVVVLNLQPMAALDYENTDTGEWLANCSACCVPEISNAFERSGVDFNVVSGMLYGEEEAAWGELEEWCSAAGAVRTLRGSRFGFLGHTYPGMLDMYSDFTMHHAQLGLHVEVLEIDDLRDRVDSVTEEAVAAKLEETRNTFRVDESVERDDLDWAARVAVGLDGLVGDFDLDALAYYYRGTNGNANESLGASLILGNSLLTARGIPASGEGDLKNAVAMKVMDALGAGGSFTEFYAMDFNDNFVLMGHDGPGHVAISDRKPILRGLGLYHGKAGHGVSVEFSVKAGPVTIFAVTQARDGRLKMLAAEGESLPGPVLRIGNTNSRLRFALPPAEFMNAWCERGPTHHCALGVGHRAETLRKICRLLDLEFVEIGKTAEKTLVGSIS